jgi:nicotinate phosphoribosyltransferase
VKRLRATHAPDTNEGELAAFTAYAAAFPSKFLALIDTYDTLHSGLPNFLCVAAALAECGYSAVGVRLDSGDLAYLSKEVRRGFAASAAAHGVETAAFKIVASNNINERVLHALEKQGHDIDTFGIGTHLVTCQRQPALGMVYKLVEVNGSPRIKLSQELTKVTIPGRKDVCVLFFRVLDDSYKRLLFLVSIAARCSPFPANALHLPPSPPPSSSSSAAAAAAAAAATPLPPGTGCFLPKALHSSTS